MSEIVLNGAVQQLAIPEGLSADEILDRHLAEQIPDDQVVCEVKIDDGEADLPRARWGQFERMVVRTGPPGDLVRKGMEESAAVIEGISDSFLRAAGCLREGDMESFRPVFVSAIDDLLSFLHFLSLSQVYLGSKEAVMNRFQRNLREQVEQLLQAQQHQDMVMLADLLEYEMVPLFQGWNGVRKELVRTLHGGGDDA